MTGKPALTKIPVSLKAAEFIRQTYCVDATDHHTFDDVLRPDFWAHVSNQLKIGDKIEVRHVGNMFYAELLVVNVVQNAAVVKPLIHVVFKENDHESIEDEEYRTQLRGPKKWSVVRNSDNHVMIELLDTKADAEKALIELKAKLAA